MPELELHPRTRRWIAGVSVAVGGAFIFLALTGGAGPAGDVAKRVLSGAFGFGAWVVPILFFIVAFFVFSVERKVAGSSIVGGSLILFSLLALLSLLGAEESFYGGRAGDWIAYPFTRAFGQGASGFLFFAAGIIGVFIFLNYPAGRRVRPDVLSREEKERAPEEGGRLRERLRAKAPDFKIRRLEKPFDEEGVPDAEPAGVSEESGEKRKKGSEQIEILPKDEQSTKDIPLPPLSLLEKEQGTASAGDIRANMGIIKRTLGNFGIEVEMGEVTVGPTVTQYTLKPAEGVRLSRIRALENDLSLALAAHPIRIEAPIPGRSLVGIEAPNQQVRTVRLRNLFEENGFQESPHRLTFTVGRSVSGGVIFSSLEKMPHLLIAGSTGSGKTIALNSLILSLLYRNTPSTLRLILVDPKRVEFPVYNDIPHLLTPVVVDVDKAINALRWAIGEMERRFDVLSESGSRDIGSYNQSLSRSEEPMPYIVVVVDELADIMASRGREAEAVIVRLAQMARAVGIHLILATQRPSVEVITGLIKANITARMAFQVASQVDSRTVLDSGGAEKLLGKGDLLFVSAEMSKPRRVQGAFVSEKEVRRVTDFLRKRFETEYEEEVTEGAEAAEGDDVFGVEIDDPLFEDAKRLVIQADKGSASYLQRRLRVGYARAARLLDMLEEEGVVGPAEGSKAREVLVSEEDMGEEAGENGLLDEHEEA